MKQKRYWLRGIGLGFIVYILFFVVSYVLILSGTVTCNVFETDGPSVQDSALCQPILLLAGVPLMAVGEFVEDISTLIHSSTISLNNISLYLGIFGSAVIYFIVWAVLGTLYGKRKNKVVSMS